MKKLHFPVAAVGAAVLVAACGGYEAVSPSPQVSTAPVIVAPAPAVVAPQGTVVAPGAVVTAPSVRSGYGRINSITPTQAGSRIGVQMDSGPLQYFDTQGATTVALGQRVEITPDSHLRYPVPDRR